MVALADVAVPAPLPRALTYLVPAKLNGVVLGQRVVCTLGGRRVIGVVVERRDGEPPPNAKPLLDVLDGVSLPEDLVRFLNRLAHYYLAPIGEVVRLALPPTDNDAPTALEELTLFSTAKGVSTRKIPWVVATDKVEASLKDKLALVLAKIRAHGALPLARITAKAAVKALEAEGLVRFEATRADARSVLCRFDRARRPTGGDGGASRRRYVDRLLRSTRAPAIFLLHGVTGSGKTEVYLRAIARAKQQKRGSVMLVPEIALTPQLVNRFRARFGDDVAVLHSGLTQRERFDMWNRLRRGEVDVAIGARSALFAPIAELGLVIVDEEHDPSFKQEEGVRYQARDMAMLRAHQSHGVCVLGSATPSLESEQLARSGRATKIVLPDRARAVEMPAVEIVDLRRIGAGPTGDRRISIVLHRAIEATLATRTEQTILFLNRRGFAPSVRCEGCGELASCPHCTVALTFHRQAGCAAIGATTRRRCL